MKSTHEKTGRKRKDWVDTSTGKPVVGLTRRTDGRWRIIGSHITSREPDERLAIARFHSLTGLKPTTDAVIIQNDKSEKYGKENGRLLDQTASALDASLVDATSLWAYVRYEILKRPKWVAEQTGVEEIGYLSKLHKPEVLPTFAELKAVWSAHCPAGDEQKRKVLHNWADFVKTTGVERLEEITPQVVISYRDNVYSRNLSGKGQNNLFSRIRRLVSFAKSRALAIVELGKILQYLELLTPSETTISLDPQPIEVADWVKLLGAAKDDNKAMVLLMLNCAMYLQEVVRLKWDEIKDGCIITHRKKTGRNVRVAVLWPETLEALKAVQRKGDYVFVSYTGLPLGVKGAELRFRALRDLADVKNVSASQLRDGAATATARGNVNEKLCALLMGHSCGISDHYVKRSPMMVKPATDAVHAAYFGG